MNSSNESVIAVIPVHGRLPLLPFTISRLLTKCNVQTVICIGSEEERKVCEDAGAKFYVYKNHPLGEKWNFGFQKARELNPFAVLFVGSSDWVCNNWVDKCKPHLIENGMVGKAGCHFLDISTNRKMRLVYWPGYLEGGNKKEHFQRKNEPIGGGRMIVARVLEKINWMPFDNRLDNSLDWSMYNKTLKAGEKVKIIHDDTIHIMAISTDKWINKHQFRDHWSNKLPSRKIALLYRFLHQYFPEALKLNL